jgi:hypothetical protein
MDISGKISKYAVRQQIPNHLIPMRYISTLIAFILLASTGRAQTIVFNMVLFGDSVGLSTITKSHPAPGEDLYVLDSHIKAKVLWITRENRTHYEARYKDGKMVSATFSEINNGKKDKWSNIQYDGSMYQVDSYHGKKSFKEVPTHSIGSLYCDVYDASRKRFFYEPEADFNELNFPDANTIEFRSSDGNKNVYHFKNGHITDAEFHTTLATVYLKRVK